MYTDIVDWHLRPCHEENGYEQRKLEGSRDED